MGQPVPQPGGAVTDAIDGHLRRTMTISPAAGAITFVAHSSLLVVLVGDGFVDSTRVGKWYRWHLHHERSNQDGGRQ